VKPAIAHQLSISAQGFADWTSPRITLSPNQFKIVTGIQLRIATEAITVDVAVLLVAAARQAGNSLNYGQGWGAVAGVETQETRI